MCGYYYVDHGLTLGKSKSYHGNTGGTQQIWTRCTSGQLITCWSSINHANVRSCGTTLEVEGNQLLTWMFAFLVRNLLLLMVKLLGSTIDKDLKWEDHVDSLYNKANRNLFILRKSKVLGWTRKISLYSLSCLPISWVLPTFGMLVLQNNMQVTRLEKIQKRVCRYILSWDYTTHP